MHPQTRAGVGYGRIFAMSMRVVAALRTMASSVRLSYRQGQRRGAPTPVLISPAYITNDNVLYHLQLITICFLKNESDTRAASGARVVEV